MADNFFFSFSSLRTCFKTQYFHMNFDIKLNLRFYFFLRHNCDQKFTKSRSGVVSRRILGVLPRMVAKSEQNLTTDAQEK